MRQEISDKPIKTIGDLVAKLLTLDQGAKPWITCSDDHYSGPVTYVTYYPPGVDGEQDKGTLEMASDKS